MRRLTVLLNEIIGSRSGKELAQIINKSPSYVTQIKSGNAIPTEETLAKIAHEIAPGRLGELLVALCAERICSIKDKSVGSLGNKTVDDLFDKAVKQTSRPSAKHNDRTFKDFPEAFEPLLIVTGDKREDRGTHISVADIGAFSASPADTRWILNLGLSEKVIKHVDKNFMLLPNERLIERFAETNILVIGSPAANHLARKVNKKAIFRFNYSNHAGDIIEKAIDDARKRSPTDLAALQESIKPELSKRLRPLFTGGIFDPTYPDDFVTAEYAQIANETQYDFGMLTFAANPYYEMKCAAEKRPNDHRYVAIMAAGIHHPATAHAVRQLGIDKRKENVFDDHPYGGVLRVTLKQEIPFSERVEQATCQWEDRADKGRKRQADQKTFLIDQLKAISQTLQKGGLKNLQLTSTEADECLRLIQSL